MVVLVLVVLVLAAGAAAVLVGDQVARDRVESAVAVRLQPELGTPEPPTVDVGESAFVPQVVAGEIDSVRVRADGVGTTTQQPLTVRHLDLTFRQVRSADRFATATAGSAEGRADLDLSALSALLGSDVVYAGNGRVSFTTMTTVLGSSLQVEVSGRPQLDVGPQTVTLADAQARVADLQLPDSATEVLMRRLVQPVPISGIPLGLQVTSIAIDEGGVHLGLAGQDIPLAR